MMRSKALALAAGLALLTMVHPSAAMAAGGDTVEDAIPITGELPIDVEFDTSAATAQFGHGCFATALHAVTFYSYRATADALLTVEASGFEEAAVVVRVGADGGFDTLGSTYCDGPVQIPAGEDYIIAVGTVAWFDDVPPGTVFPGGRGTLHLDPLPPPMDVSVTVTGATVNKQTGSATVRGTLVANTDMESYQVVVSVAQTSPPRRATNVGVNSVEADHPPGHVVDWSIGVDGPLPFRPGISMITVDGYAWNLISLGGDETGPIRVPLRPRT